MPIHFTTKSAAIFKAPNDPLSAILSSISGNVVADKKNVAKLSADLVGTNLLCQVCCNSKLQLARKKMSSFETCF